jgi:hypothetical protein
MTILFHFPGHKVVDLTYIAIVTSRHKMVIHVKKDLFNFVHYLLTSYFKICITLLSYIEKIFWFTFYTGKPDMLR